MWAGSETVRARSRSLHLGNWGTSSAPWERGVDPDHDVPEDLKTEQIHQFSVFHRFVVYLLIVVQKSTPTCLQINGVRYKFFSPVLLFLILM